MFLDVQSQLIQSKSESGRLERELKAQRLEVRSLELQLRKKSECSNTTEEQSMLRAELVSY